MGFYVIKPLPDFTGHSKLLEIAKPQEQVTFGGDHQSNTKIVKITDFVPRHRQTWSTVLSAEQQIIMPTPYNPGTLNSFRLFVSGTASY